MANKKARGVEDNPFHEHDCDACVFLGRYDGYYISGNEGQKIDLYFCPVHEEFVARNGQQGSYWSRSLLQMKNEMLSTRTYKFAISNIYINEAVDRAIKLGLTEEFRI